MTTSIYLHAAESIFRPATKLVSLDEIISIIRSTAHKDTIERIRRAQTKPEKHGIKQKHLPVFYPSTTFDENGRVCAATGIIQFDVDVSDNIDLDFDILKRDVSLHPACLYAFFSPDRGLKFGIRTDFAKLEDEDTDAMIERFKQAYRLCLEEIVHSCSIQFSVDTATKSVRQSCYLSHDPDAICRPHCDLVNLNAPCEYRPVVYTRTEDEGLAEIELALAAIPRNLSYDERLPVNLCVLAMIREAGIPVLKAHWQTDDPRKLDRQLRDQLKGARFGTIAHLWAVARQHGYKPPTGKQRWSVKPEPCDLVLEPLATPGEATEKLRSIVRHFVDTKQSQFVNVSTGAGKTETVLKTIIEYVPDDIKLLILVPTHKLGKEVVERFKRLRQQRVENAINLKDKVRIKHVIPIEGRDRACQNQEQLKIFKDKSVSMPWEFCSNHCGMHGDCSYTQQFDDPLSNIRIMTHDEWRNEQSAWFSGRRRVEGTYEPRRGRNAWTPDLIVIDEDFVRIGEVISEIPSTIFPSLGLVIESVKKGASLKDAVWMHREHVLSDSGKNVRIPLPPFTSAADYVKAVERNRSLESHSPIVDRLATYCRYEEANYLSGIWVEKDSLHFLPVRLAAKRYKDVPTLYLDATASETVVRKLLPDVQFHRIPVKQKDEIRLFQLSDGTFSRKFLNDPANVKTVINGLKSIVSRYKNVGLITYQKTASDPVFYKTLGNALNVSHVGYFKNLRGVNEFEDVDCLLIVGRFRLPPSASRNYVRAIFGKDATSVPQYGDLPVRMKDGRTVTLNTYVAENDFYQAIHDHFSLAETLQAVGRGRLVHGTKKDIYVFSNENLTTDTEIAEFFTFGDYFGSRTKTEPKVSALIPPETIDRMVDRGYIQDIEGELISHFKLTESQAKKNREKIRNELAAAGLIRRRATVRYINGTTRARNYLVSDEQKLMKALEMKGERLIEWHSIDSDEQSTH
ncbi:RAD3-like DEAD/DEAH box helicase [Paraburkholderia sp. BL6669N2]|uniref:BT4734/BF3469 family protein n=1 Tax=Paraburkholderia sp. BL6669N2 TaxID=1938807 RepID=UPI000E39DB5B|nr:BT4734/BF3469 family protein [Paraburkholderia sp. BL6669N2]REG60073.1 RAD3-like DEAD/DEAH box helicase [Paraburkholderia sp. BL6669N2]